MARITLLTSDDPDAATESVVLEGRDGECVLDTMRRVGWTHRFGCRRGGCGICRVTVVSGTTYDAALVADAVLCPEDRSAGVRLSCRAVPDTDVVLRVRSDDHLRCVNPWLAGAGARRT